MEKEVGEGSGGRGGHVKDEQEEGEVHDLGEDDVWRDTYRAIAGRYIEADAVERYIHATIDQTRALLGVDLADAKVTSWRMPVADEPATGIWARRYYAEDTRMARMADNSQ